MNISFKNMLRTLGPEFGYLKEDLAATTTPVSSTNYDNGGSAEAKAKLQADVEKNVLGQLDRSTKLDKVDTVTFGMETDDNKIVKVYVNAEQAEDFEKELAAKLGEVDDIEEVLNELSKKFEIVDVEWPDEEKSEDEDDEEEEPDGSESLDPKVYKKDIDDQSSARDDIASKVKRNEDAMENLNYGERVTLDLMENSVSSIEHRLSTPSQLLVYHALLQLGMPEVAMAKSPYRSAIINSIKQTAIDLNKNSNLKTALKNFVKRATDHEGHEDHDDDKKVIKASEDSKRVDQGNKHVEKQKDPKHHDAKHDDKQKHDPKHHGKKDDEKLVREAVEQDEGPWAFEQDDDGLTITHGKHLKISLDAENMELLAKGINNRKAVVVKTTDGKKFTFSPRGVMVFVKPTGTNNVCEMQAGDVSELMNSMAGKKPEKKEEKEEVSEATVLGAGMSKEAKARDTDESDREYIAQRRARASFVRDQAILRKDREQISGKKELPTDESKFPFRTLQSWKDEAKKRGLTVKQLGSGTDGGWSAGKNGRMYGQYHNGFNRGYFIDEKDWK